MRISDWSSDVCSSDLLEAINYAFVDTRLLDAWQAQAGAVPLANPLSAELGVMRTRLLPGLVDALARNAARQQARVRLFEIGKVFEDRESEERQEPLRSAEHTTEFQSLMSNAYDVFCL